MEARLERRDGRRRRTRSRRLTYTAAIAELLRLTRAGIHATLVEAVPQVEQRPRRCTSRRVEQLTVDPRQLDLFDGGAA